jgi:hypothetical protein
MLTSTHPTARPQPLFAASELSAFQVETLTPKQPSSKKGRETAGKAVLSRSGTQTPVDRAGPMAGEAAALAVSGRPISKQHPPASLLPADFFPQAWKNIR